MTVTQADTPRSALIRRGFDEHDELRVRAGANAGTPEMRPPEPWRARTVPDDREAEPVLPAAQDPTAQGPTAQGPAERDPAHANLAAPRPETVDPARPGGICAGYRLTRTLTPRGDVLRVLATDGEDTVTLEIATRPHPSDGREGHAGAAAHVPDDHSALTRAGRPARARGVAPARARGERGARSDGVHPAGGPRSTLPVGPYAPTDSRQLLDAEARAAMCAAPHHRHLARVRDLASDGERLVVVRDRVGVSLGRWLSLRDGPQLGELITILAPLAALVGALHAGGAYGVQLDGTAVEIDEDGAPVALGWGVRLHDAPSTPLWRETSAETLRDAVVVRSFVLDVLAHADDPVAAALADEVEDRAPAPDALAAMLLAAATPLPLREPDAGHEERHDAPGKVIAAARRGAATRRSARRSERRSLAVLDPVLRGLDSWRRRASATPPHRTPSSARSTHRREPGVVSSLVQRARASARNVRRGVWVFATFGVLAAALALILVSVPAHGEASPAATSEPAHDSPSSTPHDSSPSMSAETPDAPTPPDVATPPVARTPAPTDANPDALLDAVAAALAAREACLDVPPDMRADCIDGVLDPAGGLYAADLVADATSVPATDADADADAPATWRLPDDAVLHSAQTFGASIVVQVGSATSPASVLVVSTEAGLLIRDIWPQ